MLLLVGLTGLLAAALGVAEIRYSRINNLDTDGRWVSVKASMGRVLEKSCRFTRTSVSVARNRLDLGAYFGYQQLEFHRALPVDELALSFQATPGGQLAVFTHHDADGAEGIILRTPSAGVGGGFEADGEGGFTRFDALSGLVVSPDAWHRLELEFLGDELRVVLDGDSLEPLALTARSERVVGVRNAHHTVYVDDVQIRGPFAEGTIYDGFHGSQGQWGASLLAAGLALAGGLLLHMTLGAFAVRRRRAAWLTAPLYLGAFAVLLAWMGALPLAVKSGPPITNQLTQHIPSIMAGFGVGYALLAAGCVLLLVFVGQRERWLDRPEIQLAALGLVLALSVMPAVLEQLVFLSATYPPEEFEAGRGENCVKLDTQGHLAIIAQHHPPQLPANTQRIVFLGGSTTWGAGASSEAATWVGRIEAALAQRQPPGGVRYESVNAGVSGRGSNMLVPWFRNDGVRLEPFLVVASMGVNDTDAASYGLQLRQLALLCAERRISLIFSLEPGARGWAPVELDRMHQIMRGVADEHGLPLVDATAMVDQEWVGGFLWWDTVHMTDYGNHLYADALWPTILEAVQAHERAVAEATAP